jgi:hypothetical protein
MIMIKDPDFIAAQQHRLTHLESQLECILKEMTQIQEFLNEYKVRSDA